MDNNEYKIYMETKIKKIVGDKLYEEAKKYDKRHINYTGTYKLNDVYIMHTFSTKLPGDYFRNTVKIRMWKNKLEHCYCDCYEFYKNNNCRHIALALCCYREDLIPRPLSQKEKSINILNNYQSAKTKNVIKQQMKLEITLDLEDHENKFKLSVGVDKTYVLNTDRKLSNFVNAYQKEELKLGAKFTYNPQIHYFSDEDKKIFDFLTKNQDSYYSNFELSDRELYNLLLMLKDKGFFLYGFGRINEVKIGLPSNYKLSKQDDTYKLKLQDYNDYRFVTDDYIAYDNKLYILGKTDKVLLNQLVDNEIDELVFENKDLNLFKNGLLKTIKNNIDISEEIDEIVISSKPNSKIYIDLKSNKIVANVKFDYKGNIIDYFDTNNTNIVRDSDEEIIVINELLKCHFNNSNNKFIMDDIDDMGDFIENHLPSLADKYEVFTNKKLENIKLEKKSSIKSNFSIGKDGIMSYSFDTGNIKVDELKDVFNSLKSNKKYYKLKNGDFLKLDDNEQLNELNNLFDDLNINSSKLEDNDITIPKYRAFYINSLKDNKYNNIETNKAFDDFIKRFNKYKNTDISLNEQDNSILRQYQKDGVKWLYTLYKCDLGGILADEMGLGKSLQTICFIKQILREKKDAKIMIVCPTALVYNWKKEFDKFGSDLKYVTVADNKEKRKEIINDFDKYNIFITSYGIIRNDNDEYEDKEFELCIIDEAQAIKNYQANMTKEIKKIKARTKIALTGTPIENSVLELWSIFDFIMPGYLDNIMAFRKKYGIKDVDEKSLEKLDKLNYLIKPFILRRKKKEVFKELPEKIENNIYLELPDMQKTLYLKVLKESEAEINEMIETEGFMKARFKILQLLTKLRQICINPNVMYENYHGESIKIEKLIEIVNDFIKEGHKILIFSSFKRVIDSVQKEFEKGNISNYVISGGVTSKKRMELVEKFNKDDTNCFLITLKSGGTGLNLTGADVVIHLDIWWNPQAENQATDRAHRIGQTNNVTVIKLITKGTIEERILELQEKKKILSDNLIEGKNKSNTISDLTENEIKELLTYDKD